MTRYITLLLLAVCSLAATARTHSAKDIHSPAKEQQGGYVANPDGLLTDATVTQINTLLADVEKQTTAQVAVAVVDDIDTDIDSFASDLFANWGVGKKGADTGVLFVVAIAPHRYAIRTGRGIGGVLPDVSTARIARNELVPRLKANDINGAVMATVTAISRELTQPEAAAEIRAAAERADKGTAETLLDAVMFYVWCCIWLTAVLFVIFLWRVNKTKGLERHTRYNELYPMMRIFRGLSYVGLGMPLLVYLPARSYLRNLRDGRHVCPNCGADMVKLDEEHDNEHLTPAQDAEETFNSVDYDVWQCPSCGEEDVYAFENRDSAFVECPVCHARTARYLRDRIVKAPTTRDEGLAVKEFECLNCKKIARTPYKLPRAVSDAAKAASALPFIFMSGLGGRGGGGGFGGGGFGGGSTGGGGTSGSW